MTGLMAVLTIWMLLELAAGLVIPVLAIIWVTKQVKRISALERECAYLRGRLGELPAATRSAVAPAGVWDVSSAGSPRRSR